jgi:MscS family membrane protein
MSLSLRRSISPRTAVRSLALLLLSLFLVLQFLSATPEVRSAYTLAPPDTTNPRATFEGFRNDVNRASTLLMNAYRRTQAEPGLARSQDVKDDVQQAEALLAQSGRYLDLREVAPVNLKSRRLQATLLLKEILDRVPLPESQAIPGAEATEKGVIAGWTLPGTEIRIARVADGPRTGEYLFSPETIRRLDEFYEVVRDRPNISGSADDVYDFFSQSPGRLLPPEWFSLIEALPASFRSVVRGQAVWQWLGLGLTIGLALSGLAAIWGILRWARRETDLSASLGASVIAPGAVAVAALFVRYVSDHQINITGIVLESLEDLTEGILYIALIWGILSFSNALAKSLEVSRTAASRSIDAHLARASIRIAGIAAAITLVIYGAAHLGIPLAGLLAGLGVGGLALALAAKPTIENFIGSLILYADRPVRVGDHCRFGDLEGTVEEIGIRSTRIRGFDRTMITIPNSTFVNMNLVNLSNRDRMRYNREVRLRQTADGAAIRREIATYQAVVAGHPKIESESVQVRLRDIYEEKPKVELRALMMTSRWEEFVTVQQEIDLLLRDASARVGTPQGDKDAAGNVIQLNEAVASDKDTRASV